MDAAREGIDGTRDTRWRRVAALGAVVVAALPLLPSLARAGAPYDEGMLVAYPGFILRGLQPGRDFNYHYTPGSLWALAVVFLVFGASVVA